MFIFIIVELPQGLLAVLSTVTELQLIVALGELASECFCWSRLPKPIPVKYFPKSSTFVSTGTLRYAHNQGTKISSPLFLKFFKKVFLLV